MQCQHASSAEASGGETGDLSASHIDLLFLPQIVGFDLFVDTVHHTPVYPSGSDNFVPVALQSVYQLSVGDTLRVVTGVSLHTFTVAGFVKDSQMASSLSAATRFVVSPEAFERLLASGHGTPEIIVEFRVSDTQLIGDLQHAYENHPALPVNGQAITDTMIRIVNMVSDGLVALGLMFASLTLIVLAIINLRFVIRSNLEDEVREIATMRAIGLPPRDIGRLYLARYRLLILVACVVGGVLSLVVIDRLTQSMRTHFVLAPVTALTVTVMLIALLVVAVLVLGMSASSLRVVKRLNVVSALLHGTTEPGPQPQHRRLRSTRMTSSAVSKLAGVSPRRLPLRLVRVDVLALAPRSNRLFLVGRAHARAVSAAHHVREPQIHDIFWLSPE